jgi:amino acid transporter
MVEPLVLGSVAAGKTPATAVLGSVANGRAPKLVVLGSVAQQQASDAAYAGQLAAAATPAGNASGTPILTYVIIAAVILAIGYFLYNRRRR